MGNLLGKAVMKKIKLIKSKTTYTTTDGKEFDTHEDAAKHQTQVIFSKWYLDNPINIVIQHDGEEIEHTVEPLVLFNWFKQSLPAVSQRILTDYAITNYDPEKC